VPQRDLPWDPALLDRRVSAIPLRAMGADDVPIELAVTAILSQSCFSAEEQSRI
jgi:hypothetical protein